MLNEQDAEQMGERRDAMLSQAYLDGRRSGLQGYLPSSNPHPTGSAAHREWQLGWRSGNADRSYDDAMGMAA